MKASTSKNVILNYLKNFKFYMENGFRKANTIANLDSKMKPI